MNPEIVNYDPSGWILGDLVFVPVVVEAGQKLQASSVLGLVSATQKAKLCDKASTDGSKNPRFVLLYDIDTTETGHNGDALTRAISGGKLREDKLIFILCFPPKSPEGGLASPPSGDLGGKFCLAFSSTMWAIFDL